jgi:hypothetical protein
LIRQRPQALAAGGSPDRIQRRMVLPTLCAASTTVSMVRSYVHHPMPLGALPRERLLPYVHHPASHSATPPWCEHVPLRDSLKL